MNANERYVIINTKSGAAYLCPLQTARNTAKAEQAIKDDLCVEAEVAGRYAGQIDYERH
jgi:hypothetical protein